MRALGFIAITAMALAGCALDQSANTHNRCTTSADCTGGQTCDRNFCVSGGTDMGVPNDTDVDGGPPSPDTGIDSGALDGGDAGCVPSGATCSTSQRGVCADGHVGCGPSGPVCMRDHDPSAETCGPSGGPTDEDCDGNVDEEADQRCYTATDGCVLRSDGGYDCTGQCRPGARRCMGGVLQAACTGEVGPRANEVCQTPSQMAIDENCDGDIDEDCLCTSGQMRMCFPGTAMQAGVGACTAGMQACDTGGHWGTCTGAGSPHAETCMNNMGSDDDCDGVPDNIPGTGLSCTIAGQMGVCADGRTDCMGASGIGCVGPTASAEVCDLLDNDCDGNVDETFHVATDDANCGACGIACGTGSTCCNGTCVDTSSDFPNCGACLMDCAADSDTDACCSSSCIDTDTDAMNCGACGNVCNGGELCCGGACVDPLSDAANCNGCGMACTGTDDACCSGACHPSTAPVCTGCAVDCSMQTPAQECCGNSCRDTMTDEHNCGSCGTTCDTDEVCCGGHCFANDADHCGGACNDCAAGQLCCSDSCVPVDTRHCQSCGVTCGTGGTCCGDGCHNLASDDNNCSTCGVACGAGNHCSVSHCCPTGQTWCGSSCVNLDSNAQNCGTCGHACLLGCNGHGGCNLL